MLKIKKTVLEQIQNHFLNNDNIEQGFLLGCRQNLEQIDVCVLIPVKQNSTYFITPDAEQADEIIGSWARQKICFCGMIHSHVRQKEDLSEADLLFAEQLCQEYLLPVLWFGIGIVKRQKVEFKFYRLKRNKQRIFIEVTKYIGV